MAKHYDGLYDAIIIGAGSVGTPAAWSLAEAGVRTLVLDSRPSTDGLAWVVKVKNSSGSNLTVYVHSVCARVPGR